MDHYPVPLSMGEDAVGDLAVSDEGDDAQLAAAARARRRARQTAE